MQNEQLNEFTPSEHIHQIRSYFDIIDNAVQVGDTNRKYSDAKIPSQPGNCKENNYVTFNLSPPGENILDLYNTYITYKMVRKFNDSTAIGAAADGTNAPGFWIGFDDAYYAVAAYQLLANGRIIYSQDNAREEAYITSNSQTTEQIKKVDVFSKTRHEDVWSHSGTCRTGQIVSGAVAAGGSIDVNLTIRIPVRKFLPLEAIRFIPAFAGNIQLKVKFSSDALQCTSISVNDLIGFNPALQVKWKKDSNPPTNKFVPWSEAFTIISEVAVDDEVATITTASQTLVRTEMEFANCFIHTKSFSLDPNIYTELVEHYTGEALCFPVKVMDWIPMDSSFSKSEGATTTSATFTAAYTPINVKSIWTLFRKQDNYLVNFENPKFEYIQLSMGAYGSMPAEPETSYGPVFYEMVANACNTNNDMIGFNEDVMRSIVDDGKVKHIYDSYDNTHFLCGFPTEVDFCFQQGQASTAPITYKLTVQGPIAIAKEYGVKPLLGFMRDCCFAIQVRPNGIPIIRLDDYLLAAEDLEE
ncbi:hypothetical protein TVAGG3_0634120 [Trichomonas vaginalis G3]|uniref:hypothetical protein n=1 Tax=Trichomonas vaginalis (strain ATCC PRA-98 / G3) TaxID=412133 RepID=UPI0021E5D39D|nr:hypothetical protein TVAGG3_0634120 [Trichomonas vaginalis G3]KAI5504742.1 hypothetical protein TVAGG3_0634120 [Trichomonas vaginalis G3]